VHRRCYSYAVDVLVFRCKRLISTPLEDRRNTLKEIFGELKHPSPLALSETVDATPAELISAIKRIRFEGVVAKRKASLYEPGRRSGAWVKHRVNKGQEFVIGGYRLGGDPFDALIVGYYQNGKLYYAEKVKNGFVPRLRRDVFKRFSGLETDACPFVNLPEKRKGRLADDGGHEKMCVAQPEMVAQVEFVEWRPDGHLRHSKFIGLRDDKDPREIVRER